MKAEIIVKENDGTVNMNLSYREGEIGKNLTPDEADKVVNLLAQVCSQTCLVAFEQWLLTFECQEDMIFVNGEIYRLKMVSSKEFMTFFGKMELSRRVFQKDGGGKCYIPIDEAWGMVGQYADTKVREAILLLAALETPEEMIQCFEKLALFHPSRTCVQNVIKKMETVLEEHSEEWLEKVRDEEEFPTEEVQVAVVSIDGANVLTRTPGVKKGRPTERPKDTTSESRTTSSSYKNAMVGVVSYYGEVPQNQTTPVRLWNTTVAQMPEDKSVTFKEKFEREVETMGRRLPTTIPKIVLCDGGKNIWGYIDTNKCYESYEKLVDYYHFTEHISIAAEGIFGKESPDGMTWYRKQKATLLENEDGADRVCRSLKYYSKKKKYNTTQEKQIQQCMTFIEHNRQRMDYCRFRRNGWPIGSGPVEGACKNIVKLRMCRNGARWSNEGGQVILTLRSIVKSNRWDMFWQKYKNSLNCHTCVI